MMDSEQGLAGRLPATKETQNTALQDVDNGSMDTDDGEPTQSGLMQALSKTLSRTSITASDPPPDGGWQAWTQALMGHLVVFNTLGYINSFGVFQSYYNENMKESASELSWLGSVQIFLLFAVGSVSGCATDAGYFRATFAAGAIIQLLGVFMTSLCTKYWQLFLAQGICTGIGNGLLFTPVLACIATYFSRNRALALAVAGTGHATGGMVFPAMVRTLLPKIGFSWTIRSLGFLMLVVYLITFAFMKTRLPPRKAGPLLELTAFRETPYLLFAISMFFVFWGQYFGYFYLSSFGRDRLKLVQADSFHLIILVNGVGFFARLVPGYVSDRWCGPFNYVIPCAFITALMVYCWAAVSAHHPLIAWTVIYGWFTAGMQGLFAAMVLILTKDLRKTGVRMGMAFSVTSLALLTGPPLAGVLIQKNNGSYLDAQMWAGSVILAGAIILTGARISNTGLRLFVKM